MCGLRDYITTTTPEVHVLSFLQGAREQKHPTEESTHGSSAFEHQAAPDVRTRDIGRMQLHSLLHGAGREQECRKQQGYPSRILWLCVGR